MGCEESHENNSEGTKRGTVTKVHGSKVDIIFGDSRINQINLPRFWIVRNHSSVESKRVFPEFVSPNDVSFTMENWANLDFEGEYRQQPFTIKVNNITPISELGKTSLRHDGFTTSKFLQDKPDFWTFLERYERGYKRLRTSLSSNAHLNQKDKDAIKTELNKSQDFKELLRDIGVLPVFGVGKFQVLSVYNRSWYMGSGDAIYDMAHQDFQFVDKPQTDYDEYVTIWFARENQWECPMVVARDTPDTFWMGASAKEQERERDRLEEDNILYYANIERNEAIAWRVTTTHLAWPRVPDHRREAWSVKVFVEPLTKEARLALRPPVSTESVGLRVLVRTESGTFYGTIADVTITDDNEFDPEGTFDVRLDNFNGEPYLWKCLKPENLMIDDPAELR